MRLRSAVFSVAIVLGALGVSVAAASRFDTEDSAAHYRAVLDQYCVTCHNAVLKTAGMVLDTADVADISAAPQLWERVVTKLSLSAMPPVGIPHPDKSFYDGFLAYLQAGLDEAAGAQPNPGRPTVHRLNRTEYANAIRDLLAIDTDVAALLPADNIGEGFDNIAEVLAVSPLLMERYLFAAGPAPSCLDAADANDDGTLDIADAIAILGHLFGNAGPLPQPFAECGADETEDELGCQSFVPCEQ